MAKSNKEAQITFKANTNQFTQAIKQMNSTMSTLDKELALVNTQMKGSGQSVELLQKKHDLLSQKLEASGTKVENLKAKLDEAKRVFGENSEEANKLGNQLLTAQNQYARLENQIGQVDDRMGQLNQQAREEASALGQLENTISQQESALEQLKREYQNVALEQGQSSDEAKDLARQIKDLSSELNENRDRLKDVQDATDDLEGGMDGLGGVLEGLRGSFDTNIASSVALGEAIADLAQNAVSFTIDKIKEFAEYLWELPEATEEVRTCLAKVESSATNFGYKTKDAQDMYNEFQKYIADPTASGNAVTNLMGVQIAQEDLNDTMNACIATWTAYPDSIPIESLTEAVAETITTGEVTGNLADTLNWTAQEQEEFQKKLDACTTKEERARLITEHLNNTYGKSKEVYDELNEAQINQNNANTELENTQARLAEAILPIQTGFTNLKNTILQALTPAIQWVSDKIQGLIDCFNNLSPQTQEIITTIGIVTGVVLILVGVLGTIAVSISAVSAVLGFFGITLATVGATILPIIGIILAVIAVITLIVLAIKNWGAITDWLSEKWNQFKEWIGGVWDSIKAKCSEVWDGIKAILTTVWNIIQATVMTKITLIKGIIITVWNAIKTFTSTVWNGIKTVISTVWNAIKTTVQNAINNVKTKITTVWNAIKTVTSTVWNTIKTVLTTVWNAIKSTVQNAINNVKTKITTGWNAIRNVTRTVWNTIKSTITTVWNSIKSTIQNAINRVKSIAQSGFNAVKTHIINPLKSAYNTVRSVFSNIYNTIRNKINSAKDAVSSAISRIKGLMNFKWSIPKPSLPHFNAHLNWSSTTVLGKTFRYPSGISWNKLGGIFSQPTIFATPNAGLQGVGEAGAEAILPLDSFYNHLDNKLESIVRATAIDYDKMASCMAYALGNVGMYMDGKKVGQLTSKTVDDDITARKSRLNRLGGGTNIE